MTSKALIDILTTNNTKIFSTLYTKMDGSTRRINCALRRTDLDRARHNLGLVLVYDMKNRGYRTLRVDRMHDVRMRKGTIRLGE